MSSERLEKSYEPREVEKRWYEFWMKEGLFHAEKQSEKPPFSIVIPPPNVTGVLHMGHALNNTIQDILCRYKRLRGYNVLWMPGTDHAGIATQNVVEKKLALDGVHRDQMGRERFIEKVWEWRQTYGGAIINQLKRLGASCDWDRERFTMDEGLSLAVKKVFVQLYKEGLIFRGNYIINWCPRCQTALSDLEVEHEEVEGKLYHIRYPFAGGQSGIVVATTRPETMLGDTAVAVNPEDKRYKDLEEETVILPVMNRQIPIIRDSYVDMEFGTGGLKITPAHDPNDFEIARIHELPAVRVIDDQGCMTSEAGDFTGMDRFECRKALVESLKKDGFLEKTEDYPHSVGHCYRCNTMVEPNLSLQWFVRAKPLAEKAIEAVETGNTRIIPENWKKTYYDWMYNIRDWCISRQIWWGHQIPAWTCDHCQEMVVEMDAPETCPSCGNNRLTQEEDVLDTWFSSALWPFSTMGWPEETPLLKTFYPTSSLVTAFDILFFWVARMMMMGIHFMKDVPFKDVYIHALVRDEDGQKMSKSKGNIIDPLTVIDNYGTDAFRFTLAAFAAMGRDVKMSEKRVEGYRHFINKIWNAVRFSMMHLRKGCDRMPDGELSLIDRWILSRLKTCTEETTQALEEYRFNEAAGTLYRFVWHEFCDWYLEGIKPVLYGEDEAQKDSTRKVLWRVLNDTTVLLHPFVPFITEEIWHKMPDTSGSVMRAVYPKDREDADRVKYDPVAESRMQTVMDVITGIRNIRGEMNILPSLELVAYVRSEEKEVLEVLDRHRGIVENLARLKSLSVAKDVERPKSSATAVLGNAILFIPLEGIINFEKESQRLQKELNKLEDEIAAMSKKLNNEDFLNKAPEEVVEKVKEKHRVLADKYANVESNLSRIKKIVSI